MKAHRLSLVCEEEMEKFAVSFAWETDWPARRIDGHERQRDTPLWLAQVVNSGHTLSAKPLDDLRLF